MNEGQGLFILTRISVILREMEESGRRSSVLSISDVLKVHDDTCLRALYLPSSVERKPSNVFPIAYQNQY